MREGWNREETKRRGSEGEPRNAHEHLTVGADAAEDLPELLLESLVDHPVSLINDEVRHALELLRECEFVSDWTESTTWEGKLTVTDPSAVENWESRQ